MRAVIQRVASASVSVDGQLVSEIGKGLCCLIGISVNDGPDDAKWLAKKLLSLRLFENEEGKMW